MREEERRSEGREKKGRRGFLPGGRKSTGKEQRYKKVSLKLIHILIHPTSIY